MLTAGTFLLCCGLLLLLAAEALGAKSLAFVAKPAASFGFLLVGASSGSDGAFRILLLLGLAFCFAGDLALLGDSHRAFLVGLASFLLGHLAFAGAFAVAGLSGSVLAVCLVLLAIPAIVVWRWLMPHVARRLRPPVAVYMVAISLMLGLATARLPFSRLTAAGALLFYLSDLTVARDRFIARRLVNRVIGLPLYYAGVWLIALPG